MSPRKRFFTGTLLKTTFVPSRKKVISLEKKPFLRNGFSLCLICVFLVTVRKWYQSPEILMRLNIQSTTMTSDNVAMDKQDKDELS